jgi:hypothetical protein
MTLVKVIYKEIPNIHMLDSGYNECLTAHIFVSSKIYSR